MIDQNQGLVAARWVPRLWLLLGVSLVAGTFFRAIPVHSGITHTLYSVSLALAFWASASRQACLEAEVKTVKAQLARLPYRLTGDVDIRNRGE